MSNVHRLPDQDPTLEACEWLARLERGLNDEEDLALREWLAASPRNSAALMETAGLWDRMSSLSRLADLFPKPAPRRARHTTLALALAASVVLALVVGLFTALWPKGGSDRKEQVAAAGYQQLFETAVGEHSTIRLPDGSELTLNTNSRVHAQFDEDSRTLRLERGEAYVKVAHDKERPLTVWAGDRLVRAVGTEFSVEIKDDQRVEVIVTEGEVLIGVMKPDTRAHEPAWLEQFDNSVSAGQRVLLGQEQHAVEQLSANEIDVKLAWRDGNIVFHGEPLAEALVEIERYTRVTFVIRDEELRAIRVAGLFKAGDVDGLLKTLRQNFNISYERVGAEKIVLKGQ